MRSARGAPLSTLYLDSSALIKLIVSEPESGALLDYLTGNGDRASSALARVEVSRALHRIEAGDAVSERAERVFRRIALVRLDDALLDEAARLEPPTLRSLDAIHIATALALGPEPATMVTYDHRMAEGSVLCGLEAVAPA